MWAPGRDPRAQRAKGACFPPGDTHPPEAALLAREAGAWLTSLRREPDSLLLPDTTAPSEMTPTCPDARSWTWDGGRPPSSTCPLGKASLPQYTPHCPQHPARAPPLPTAPCRPHLPIAPAHAPTLPQSTLPNLPPCPQHPAHSPPLPKAPCPHPPRPGRLCTDCPAVAAPLRPDAFPKDPEPGYRDPHPAAGQDLPQDRAFLSLAQPRPSFLQAEAPGPALDCPRPASRPRLPAPRSQGTQRQSHSELSSTRRPSVIYDPSHDTVAA